MNRVKAIDKIEDITTAFIIYAKWNDYGHYTTSNAARFIQEKAEQLDVYVKIKDQKGKHGEYSPQSKYTHIIEVYGNKFDDLLGIRRAIGNCLSWAHPNTGYCYRCHVIWSSTKQHDTHYSHGGCFPLCEWCWTQLTPKDRWPYYQMLILKWESMDYAPNNKGLEKEAIRKSVFAGN